MQDKQKSKITFKQRKKKQGHSKRKKVNVYCIDIQNFLRLSRTWHTQQISWHTFARCIRDMSHPVLT